MDKTICLAVNSAVADLKQWKTTTMLFPHAILDDGTVDQINLADFIGSDCMHRHTVVFDQGKKWADPLQKDNRRALTRVIAKSCREGGFEVASGWQGDRSKISFRCNRGRLFKTQKARDVALSKQRKTKTGRPRDENSLCPFTSLSFRLPNCSPQLMAGCYNHDIEQNIIQLNHDPVESSRSLQNIGGIMHATKLSQQLAEEQIADDNSVSSVNSCSLDLDNPITENLAASPLSLPASPASLFTTPRVGPEGEGTPWNRNISKFR